MLELYVSSIKRKSEMTIKMDAGIGALKKKQKKQQTKKEKKNTIARGNLWDQARRDTISRK